MPELGVVPSLAQAVGGAALQASMQSRNSVMSGAAQSAAGRSWVAGVLVRGRPPARRVEGRGRGWDVVERAVGVTVAMGGTPPRAPGRRQGPPLPSAAPVRPPWGHFRPF